MNFELFLLRPSFMMAIHKHASASCPRLFAPWWAKLGWPIVPIGRRFGPRSYPIFSLLYGPANQ